MALRTCIVLALFAALAITVVYLRTEQTRCLARSVAEENRWVEMRQELWRLETSLARLRTPSRLYGTMNLFRTDLATRGVRVLSSWASQKSAVSLGD